MQDMYERTKAAYLELEMEYKNGIQAERGERSEIYSMYQELSRRQQESEKVRENC